MQTPSGDPRTAIRGMVFLAILVFHSLPRESGEAQAQCGIRGNPACVTLGEPYLCFNPLRATAALGFFGCQDEIYFCKGGLQYDTATKICKEPTSGIASIEVGTIDF